MMANKRFERDAPTAGFAACFRAPQATRSSRPAVGTNGLGLDPAG